MRGKQINIQVENLMGGAALPPGPKVPGFRAVKRMNGKFVQYAKPLPFKTWHV
jgi:hypothetical protein